MRLLYENEHGQLAFTENLHDNIPSYGILSHTWGNDGDEVTYQDILQGTGEEKEGYGKLRFCLEQAREAKIKHFWVDTCCIDKRSESELAMSIRSMFRWYAESAICWVYLTDVSSGKRSAKGGQAWQDTFRTCRWFTRGWTLQELLAPKQLHFYARSGYLGDRSTLCQIIHEITGIDTTALQGQALSTYSHLHRLQWATARITKVAEDRAYSLLGICEVSVGPRYGEGYDDARRRLESKIVKRFGSSALERAAPTGSASADRQTKREEHRQQILELLKFDAMASRRTTIKKALHKTCRWVLQTAQFLSWMQPDVIQEHYGFLWIKGKPGAGKSVLMRFLDDHANSTKLPSDIVISFYFHARGEELEHTQAGMYRSLLVQLLEVLPEMHPALDSTTINLINDSSVQIAEFQRLISTVVSKLGSRRLYLYIDALDECVQDDIQDMIHFFQSLGEEAFDEGIHSQVCFASRHYPLLVIPTGLQLTLEDAVEHSHDLERYIRRHLHVGPAKQADKISKDLLDKANGVFLWVVLVVDILSKEFVNGRIFAVQKRLEELPPGLSDLFRDIIRRDGHHLQDFLLCLQWILYAKQPLELPEYYFAMLAGLDPTASQAWDREELTETQMHSFLLSSSKGLAETTKGKKTTVQFIHESVRDFLVREHGLQTITADAEQASEACAHEVLKTCCLIGMSVDLIADLEDVRNPQFDSAKTTMLARYPFLEYAVQYLLSHAEGALLATSQTEFLETIFDLEKWRRRHNVVCKYKVDRYKDHTSLIYILAERDLVGLLEAPTNGIDDYRNDWAQNSFNGLLMKRSRNGRYRIPLLAAFATKSRRAACMLLHWSNATEPERIVDEVLSQWSGIQYQHPNTSLAAWSVQFRHARLFCHVAQGWESISDNIWSHARWAGSLNMLIPVAVNCIDINVSRCCDLLEASMKENDRESSALVVSQHAQRYLPEGSSILGLAIAEDCPDLVRLLVDDGADVNECHAGQTLLTHAMELFWANMSKVTRVSEFPDVLEGYTRILRTLVNAGADVDGLPDDRAALQLAIVLGSKSEMGCDLAHRMIDAGANLNASYENTTLLKQAVILRDIDMVQLLINAGADLESRSDDRAALSIAVYLDHYEIVALLFKSGAHGNATDGNQALHLAIMAGDVGMVQMLIDAGAELESRRWFGRTALADAVHFDQCEIVALLLESGADPHATDNFNRTVLELCALDGSTKMFSLFLSYAVE